MNVLLYEHYLQVAITSPVVQLIAYPLGTGWEKFMPNARIFGVELNPGPFNKKEHTLITMMAAAGTSISYSISILIAQQIFYGQSWGWGFQILLIMSTQAMGFGLAGVMRRFLIWPAAMVVSEPNRVLCDKLSPACRQNNKPDVLLTLFTVARDSHHLLRHGRSALQRFCRPSPRLDDGPIQVLHDRCRRYFHLVLDSQHHCPICR